MLTFTWLNMESNMNFLNQITNNIPCSKYVMNLNFLMRNLCLIAISGMFFLGCSQINKPLTVKNWKHEYEFVDEKQLLGIWKNTHQTTNLLGSKKPLKDISTWDFRENGKLYFISKGKGQMLDYSIVNGDIIIEASESFKSIMKVHKLEENYMEWDEFHSIKKNNWRWNQTPYLMHMQRVNE